MNDESIVKACMELMDSIYYNVLLAIAGASPITSRAIAKRIKTGLATHIILSPAKITPLLSFLLKHFQLQYPHNIYSNPRVIALTCNTNFFINRSPPFRYFPITLFVPPAKI